MLDAIYIPSFFLIIASIFSAILPNNKSFSKAVVAFVVVSPLVFLALSVNTDFGIFLPVGWRSVYGPLDVFIAFYIIFIFLFSYIFFYRKEDKAASVFLLLYLSCFCAMLVAKELKHRFAFFEIMIILESICFILRSININNRGIDIFNTGYIFLAFLSIFTYSFFLHSMSVANIFGISLSMIGIDKIIFPYDLTNFFLSAFFILRFSLFPFSAFYIGIQRSLSVFVFSIMPFLQALSTLYFCYVTKSIDSLYCYELIPVTVLILSFGVFTFSNARELILFSSFCSICIGLMIFLEIPLYGIIFIATSGFFNLFLISFFCANFNSIGCKGPIKGFFNSNKCFFISKILTVFFGAFSFAYLPVAFNFKKIIALLDLSNNRKPIFFISVFAYLASSFISFFYRLTPLVLERKFIASESYYKSIFFRTITLFCTTGIVYYVSQVFEIKEIGFTIFSAPCASELYAFYSFFVGMAFACCAFLDTKPSNISTISIQLFIVRIFSYVYGITYIFIDGFFDSIIHFSIFFFIFSKKYVRRLRQMLYCKLGLGFSLFAALVFAVFCFALAIAKHV